MKHEDKVNIVVVDLPAQRMTMEAALEELGENIITLTSGREALKFLLDHDAAVILLDVNMPEMDETAALIRQRPRSANIPIIFLTAYGDEIHAARGYATGAVDYLVRPFIPDVLRTKVGVFVALSRAREQVRREADRQIAFAREQSARAAAEEQSRRLGILAEATGVLGGAIDGSAPLESLPEMFVPRLADVAGLRLARPQLPGSVWRRAPRRGVREAGPEVHAALSRVLSSGTSELLVRGDEPPWGIVLPLIARRQVAGALALAMTSSGRRYEPADVELVREVVGRASIAYENRLLYDELQDRDRRKDEFLAMLSHELRNPLGAITTAVRLLEFPDASAEHHQRAREVIGRQSLHLTRLVDDLLEVSRVTSGRIEIDRRPVDLRQIVDRAVDSLHTSGRLGDHQLAVRGEDVIVEADAARMEQVITNLLVNAVKYTDEGGEIDVAIETDGDDAVVRVRDTGIGIAPDLLPKLFEVFVQGRQALDRAQGGLGLGLALVRKLVELQGGTVTVESGGIGQGSTFTIRMPCASSPIAATQPPPIAAPRSLRLRILIVEDNPDAREMLRILLETEGHEVHEATNGPAALEQARRVRPQIGLVDLGLPGFDGLELARLLRVDELTRGMTLVAVSGYGQSDDLRRTFDAGFDDHLVKPVAPEKLVAVLRRALPRSHELAASTEQS